MGSLEVTVVVVLFALAAFVAWRLSRRTPTSSAPPPPEPETASETERAGAPPTDPPPIPAVMPKLYTEEEEDALDPTKMGELVRFTLPAEDADENVVDLDADAPGPIKRIVYDEDASDDEPTRADAFFLVHATAQTDTGKRRKRNEDSLLVLDDRSLYAVADGMGGHRGGERASQLAVDTVRAAFETGRFGGREYPELPRPAAELARAIHMANRAVHREGKADLRYEGMGTTICAARFSPKKKRVYIGHVGDSRCYRMRDGVLQQITADHTMAELGATGPEANRLSRAVGVWSAVPVDIVIAHPLVGDTYLLCSDGLTKMLSDDTIGVVLRHEEDPKALVERLVLFANEHGGKDNISIIVVKVVEPQTALRS
ncbi:MAG TPA: protein phosphatase 2C domain-containing protein [Labilithrix sp.]